MGGQSKQNWGEMIDYAIHSGGGDKISRQKIKTYITDNWGIPFETDKQKESLKDGLKARMDAGYVKQEGQSFLFTDKGEQHYSETYASDDEEEEEEGGTASSSPKAAPAGTKKKK